ncbi:mannose-1-phosphate guanylyltransferase [Pedobacter ureilyticus]|uniref:Mannose-1-phosphate guanylyltransferase n=1 Tax=Pedobacter ureilyticus TaxID=1393051 RepID=A0ABW9J6V1_9SPHI|nr:mannose-1-phosphate guanylyltransferase [Pedobacter helvus]
MSISNRYVLIMAGGVGSRFWPKSRNSFPKQFIDILGTGQSLLQITYARFLKICDAAQIYVLTNNNYVDLVLNQLSLERGNIIVEPSRNNTAPCLAYANAKISKINPEANIVVAPSDHLILKEDEFLSKIEVALSYAEANDALITLGIKPTRPDTGYGYIKYENEQVIKTTERVDEVKKVEAFVEKPQLEIAEEYLKNGDYLWNAGIFIWSARSFSRALEVHAPSIYELFNRGLASYGTEQEAEFINLNYPTAKNISIDFAVMEKATNIFTIPADIGWSDLGTWASLHEVTKKDNDNSINSKNFILNNTKDCIVSVNNHKAVIIDGLENYIVVDDDEVLLIYPKAKEQEIKEVSSNFVNSFGSRFN